VASALSTQSYASIVRSSQSTIRVSRGSTLDIQKTKYLIVTPKDESIGLTSSREIRDVLEKTLKPSDFNLKVRKILSTRNNGVRIEAHSVDLNKIKSTQMLDKTETREAGTGDQNKPEALFTVLCGLTKEDLTCEIISLNLKDVDFPDVKIIYVFPPKHNRRLSDCIIEIPPNIRALLLKDEYIFINYSLYKISDYIRVLGSVLFAYVAIDYCHSSRCIEAFHFSSVVSGW